MPPTEVKRRPGRPPTVEGGHDFTARVRMPRSLWDRLEAVAGEGRASEVAREEIERGVKRRERRACGPITR